MKFHIIQIILYIFFSLKTFAQNEMSYTYSTNQHFDYYRLPLLDYSKNKHIALTINYDESAVIIILNQDLKVVDSLTSKQKNLKTQFLNDSIFSYIDINEKNIFNWNIFEKNIDTLKFNKPEDWYLVNNNYKMIFEGLLFPISYYLNSEAKTYYKTRFDYLYSLYSDERNNIYYIHPNNIEQITYKNDFINKGKKEGEALFFSNYIYLKMEVLFLDKKNNFLYFVENDGLKRIDFNTQSISIINNCYQCDYLYLSNKFLQLKIDKKTIKLSYLKI
ncbi:MAG: hypothetical protein BWY22_01531 [Bacteroidetes bacterium ADurb.Bin217]|nr:MAG: hypothetical protein BWY22_01531 [Bacteroidetes bacterium ADurb.Bin217]